ncbi:MAG: glycosyltransferase family 4 protein [Rubellimicrobium sp.]|nr:glycosyltransferase family 4 protein [Rubellimicrobium sp.]
MTGAATDALPGPLVCLAGEYPRLDELFILREVAALRALGLAVETCTLRRTGPEHLAEPGLAEAAAGTFHLREAARRPRCLLRAHRRALGNLRGWLGALALAWRTGPGGMRGRLYNLGCLLRAVVLADWLAARGAVHLQSHDAAEGGTIAMLAARMAGIPFSLALDGPDTRTAPARWRLDEKIARAAFVACASHAARSQAMLFSDAAHWDRLHIVHPGVDPARHVPAPRRGAGGLVHVGRLMPAHGLTDLIEALAAIRSARAPLRLTLVGEGSERARLEALAQALGVDVTFAGYRSDADLPALLAGADAFVLPGLTGGLSMPMVEAMAARLPVVAVRVDGVPDLVEDGVSGRLVPPGNAEALALALLEVTGSPATARRMGEAGRARVERDFDAATEAAWLAVLILSVRAGGVRPGVRPS